MTQEWWLIMTSTPDNRPREEPLSAYEYGVWVFLAFAGGTALGLIAYLGYKRLFCLSGAGRYSTEIDCCYNDLVGGPINH